MQPISEKRRHPRQYDHTCTMEFSLNGTCPVSKILGADINTSDSGMCVYTLDRLEQGDVVDLKTTLPPEQKKAKVVWVRECSPDLYKVGLMFRPGSPELSANRTVH